MSENNSCCCSSGGCCGEPAIQIVSTKLTFKDICGAWRVRWGIGRADYKIDPGLYAVGTPDKKSPVLVSANYKLTFDSLRKELSGINCWILILDTKGVNVWCAAGKGTFGTDELTTRLAETKLTDKVSHKTLILPQLGAVGVNANKVKNQSGFSVVYGPIRAQDIKAFIKSGYKATKEMRTVKFTMLDRLVLTPMEIVPAAKKSIIIFGFLFLLNLFSVKPFGIIDFIVYAGAVFVGTFITPLLLPFIPGRAFSFKGGSLGLLWAIFVVWRGCFDLLSAIGYIFVLPSISAYLTMNFTGASTYTSPSGVLKEMKFTLPFIICASVIGTILILINRILGI